MTDTIKPRLEYTLDSFRQANLDTLLQFKVTAQNATKSTLSFWGVLATVTLAFFLLPMIPVLAPMAAPAWGTVIFLIVIACCFLYGLYHMVESVITLHLLSPAKVGDITSLTDRLRTQDPRAEHTAKLKSALSEISASRYICRADVDLMLDEIKQGEHFVYTQSVAAREKILQHRYIGQ